MQYSEKLLTWFSRKGLLEKVVIGIILFISSLDLDQQQCLPFKSHVATWHARWYSNHLKFPTHYYVDINRYYHLKTIKQRQNSTYKIISGFKILNVWMRTYSVDSLGTFPITEYRDSLGTFPTTEHRDQLEMYPTTEHTSFIWNQQVKVHVHIFVNFSIVRGLCYLCNGDGGVLSSSLSNSTFGSLVQLPDQSLIQPDLRRKIKCCKIKQIYSDMIFFQCLLLDESIVQREG